MKQKRPSDFGKDLVEIGRELHAATDATATSGPELALFVVWDKARDLQTQILEAISATFEIRGVHEISWDRDRADENFARFYQGRPAAPYGTFFSDQKGCGPFLLITVVDDSPCYETRETHRGPEVLNARCFDLKHRIRRDVGGVMRVHSTDTAAEAERDLLLLLGVTASTYLNHHTLPWDGNIESIRRNLTGADGWTGIPELLDTLNHGVRYVLVREFDNLPHTSPNELCIVTDNYHETIRLLNARSELRGFPPWGGRFVCRVAEKDLPVDVRLVGDRYYDEDFTRTMLERRCWHPGGFFVPTAHDQFESLVWHAMLRERHPTPRNWQHLVDRACALGREFPADSAEATASLGALLLHEGRCPVAPRDRVAFHDYRAAGCSFPILRSRVSALERRGWMVWLSASYWLRYGIVTGKQRLARAFPGLRMMWPSYRRLVQGPVADRAHG